MKHLNGLNKICMVSVFSFIWRHCPDQSVNITFLHPFNRCTSDHDRRLVWPSLSLNILSKLDHHLIPWSRQHSVQWSSCQSTKSRVLPGTIIDMLPVLPLTLLLQVLQFLFLAVTLSLVVSTKTKRLLLMLPTHEQKWITKPLLATLSCYIS